MDNLAHTLLGAALGQAGLKRRTGLGMATLMIAASLPDVDALGLLVGENLAWRRGLTHGPLGILLLPPLLAVAMLWFDRWQARRGRRPDSRPPVDFKWLLVLSYLGALTHPLLDFLNTYGIRCLMPFSERWFYGDTLFIIDIWVWLTLGLGIWWSRRRERMDKPGPQLPVIAALVAVTCYTIAMGLGSRAAEQVTARAVAARGQGMPDLVVANPVLVDSLRRRMVYRIDDAYGFGDLRWTPTPRLTLSPDLVPTNMDDPAVWQAARHKKVADFLYWSRLPFAMTRETAEGTEVIIGDARYNRRPDDGSFFVRVVLPRAAE